MTDSNSVSVVEIADTRVDTNEMTPPAAEEFWALSNDILELTEEKKRLSQRIEDLSTEVKDVVEDRDRLLKDVEDMTKAVQTERSLRKTMSDIILEEKTMLKDLQEIVEVERS